MKNRLVALLLSCFTGASFALDLELTQGINAALPIAINAFSGAERGEQLTGIIQSDLQMSGQFRLIPTLASGQSDINSLRQAGATTDAGGPARQFPMTSDARRALPYQSPPST